MGCVGLCLVVAVLGTHVSVAVGALPPERTKAFAPHAHTIVGAVLRARVCRTVEPRPSLLTHTRAILTHTVLAAVLGARAIQTICAHPPLGTHAERVLIVVVGVGREWPGVRYEWVDAFSVSPKPAILEAPLQLTAPPSVLVVTQASSVVAFSVSAAVVRAPAMRAIRHIRNVVVGELCSAMADASNTLPVWFVTV